MVQYFVENVAVKDEIAGLIRQIGDLERLISKVAVNRINPKGSRSVEAGIESH